MPSVCDLHIHSSYSDGILSPTEIVRRAAEKKLAAVSVTDHDTIGGQREALEAGKKLNMEVIEGVEFSVKIGQKGFHILGYLVDYENRDILDSIEWLREKRLIRFRKILEKLGDIGIHIEMDEIRNSSETDSYGRPHLARLMLKKGFISYYQEAFARYLGDGRKAYVPKEVLSMERVFELIRGAGGVPVWAHPGGRILDNKRLREMIEMGLKGVEVWHPNHNYDLEHRIAAIAGEYGLVATGGSDFHFAESMKVDIGGKHAPYDSVCRLRELADLS